MAVLLCKVMVLYFSPYGTAHAGLPGIFGFSDSFSLLLLSTPTYVLTRSSASLRWLDFQNRDILKAQFFTVQMIF